MTCPKELEEALQKLEAKEKNAALYCGVDDAIFIRSPAAKEAIKAVLRRQILLCVERGKRLFFLTGLTWFEIFAGEVLEEIKKELPEINYWLLSRRMQSPCCPCRARDCHNNGVQPPSDGPWRNWKRASDSR